MAEHRCTFGRSMATLVIVAVAVGLVPAAAHAAEVTNGPARNVVELDNQSDGQLKAKARGSVALDPGPTIDDVNAALARSSCTDCRTVAVAVQVVVMIGAVTDFRPENAAVAVNENCLRCQTLAYARQEVLASARPVTLRAGARQRIDGIEARMQRLAWSPLPFDRLTETLDALTAELVAAVQHGLTEAGTTASSRTGLRQVDRHDA